MDPRARIWAFGVSKLRDVYRDIAADYDDKAQLRIVAKGFEEAVQEVERAGGEGPDVVVSAGSNGNYLKHRLSVPVVLVTPTGFDVMHALVLARRIEGAIGLVMYGDEADMPRDMVRFLDVFGANVFCRSYTSAQDAERHVSALRDAGVRVIVGPGLVTDLADAAGLQSVFLYSRESVRLALDTALDLVDAARVEAARRRRLDQVLAHLRDGVVALDASGRIEALSARMASMLEVVPSQVVGKRLQELAKDIAAVIPTLSGESLETVRGTSYLVHRNAWGDPGSASGAIITFQEAVAVQRMDRSVRARQRTSQRSARYRVEDLVGESPAMHRVREQVRRYARSDATVLIRGESGTGKELAAQSLHNGSARHPFPFVVLNCGAFPETLLESELFGYEEGAFTGARRGGKPGLIETAHRGTLFLDEIGEMPLSLQSRLLRVLQEREVVRLGSTEPLPVDVRIIAATHRPLAACVDAGTFRADLFYRLNILNVTLPPLRERGADIAQLAGLLLCESRALPSVDAARIALAPVRALLTAYPWPGNVRELQNIMARIAVDFEGEVGGKIEDKRMTPERLRDVAPEIEIETVATASRASSLTPRSVSSSPLRDASRRTEADAVRETLAAFDGDRDRTAQALGISKTTLWRKLKKP